MQTQTRSQHELKLLAVLCAGTFLFFNSYGSINVTLPTIQAAFGQSLAAVQWVSTIGLVMSSSLALGLGRLGDILGRKRLYKTGVVLYTLGAALSAAAQSFPELVGFRVLMTLGLSMAMPLASAILVSEANVVRRGATLGILLGSGSIGRATGPAVGGFFLWLSGWRAVFLANAGIGLLVSLAVWWVMRGREDKRKGSINLQSTLGFVAGYPSILIAISLGANDSWKSPIVALFVLFGAFGFGVFAASEARSRRPLVPPRLLRNFSTLVSLFALMAFSISYFPILVLSPLYLQNVLVVSPLNLGLLLTTLPVAAAIFSPLSGRLADRFDPLLVVVLGLLVGACGEGAYAMLGSGSSQGQVLLALGLVGIGIGLVLPANQKFMFGSTSKMDYGVLGGLLAVCGPGAGALGIGIAVALVAAIEAGASLQGAQVFEEAQRSAMWVLVPLPLIASVFMFKIYRAHRAVQGAKGVRP